MVGDVNVLVIDDNPGDRRFIKESLENAPLDVAVYAVTTREDALAVLSQQRESREIPRPDVIFLDWSLSDETSEELSSVAKSANPAILLVAMTGTDPDVSTMRSAVPQADVYVQKPTETDGYVEILRSVLSEQ